MTIIEEIREMGKTLERLGFLKEEADPKDIAAENDKDIPEMLDEIFEKVEEHIEYCKKIS